MKPSLAIAMLPELRLFRLPRRWMLPLLAMASATMLPAIGHADNFLDADDVRALMSETTINTISFRSGEPMHFTFRASGSLEGVLEHNSRTMTDDGKWWVQSNGQLCYQFSRFAQGRPHCPYLRRVREGIDLYRSDGTKLITWKIRDLGPNGRRVAVRGSRGPMNSPTKPPAKRHAGIFLDLGNVRALMSGTTIDTIARTSHEPMHLTFRAGGSLEGVLERDFQTMTDDGKWWIKPDGQLCYRFSRFGHGQLYCPFLRRVAEGIDLHRIDGTKLVTWKIHGFGPNARQVAIAGPLLPNRLAEQGVPGMAGRLPKDRLRPPGMALKKPTPPPADTVAPTITLPDKVETSESTVTVAGRVQDQSRVVELTINQRPIAVAPDGSFTVQRGVPQGESTIVVSAMDEWGNRSKATLRVMRNGPAVLQQALLPPAGRAIGQSASRPATSNPLAGLNFGRYHALVIGNNKYKYVQNLKTAVNDARAVANLLRKNYGFHVKLLTNATREQVIGGLAEMRATLKPDDSLLVYYAGHGVYDKGAGEGYWLPVDAEEGNPANWISTNDITTMLRVIRAKHVLVVADSCYSGTLVRAVNAHIKTAEAQLVWIKRMLAKRARVALVSGGLEPVSDGNGAHSVFAKAFLEALGANHSVLSGEALFDAIKRPVVLNADQTPQYSDIRLAGHEGGDFLFVPGYH